MGIKKNLRYDFSVLHRQQTPTAKLHVQRLTMTLIGQDSPNSSALSEAHYSGHGNPWKQ